MQSLHNNDQPIEGLTGGPVKPTCCSAAEKPNPRPETPHKPIQYNKSLSTSSFEKAYDFFTSLPVSSALLAFVISQGASINNSMWYVNYAALAAILLTCVAVGISYLSVPASHRFCESVFLTIYTPARQLLSVNISLHDSHDAETTRVNNLARQETCAWIKRLLLSSAMAAATYGLTFAGAAYVALTACVYHLLSAQLAKIYIEDDKVSSDKKWRLSRLPADELARTGAAIVAVALDISCFGWTALGSLVYFLVVDGTVRRVAADVTENRNVEALEGQERHFARGAVYLAEVAVVAAAILANPSPCLLYFAVFYFNVYAPLVAFRQNMAVIRAESLCLSNFARATAADLASYDDVCAVCLGAMSCARITPCKHIFHGKCLKDCLSKKAQCPMCNAQVL